MHFFLLFVFITWIQAKSNATQCPPTVSSIQPILDEALMYGAALTVVDANGIIYEQAFGYDSPVMGIPRREIDVQNSIFLLASISKTFIAVAAMQMVEANRLNLDANINEYLPVDIAVVHPLYPNIPITMRQLLMHTSSIAVNSAVELESYTPNDIFTDIDMGVVLKKFFNSTNVFLPIPPGNKTYYSNGATSLAAYVIERLAGMRFEHYVREKIWKPLGITENMGSYRLSDFDQKYLVRNYLYNDSISEVLGGFLKHFNATQVENTQWIYLPFPGSSLYPSGYARMSARGLSIFLQAFLRNFTTLLRNSSSVEQMVHVAPQESYNTGLPSEFGLIWNWITLGKRHLIGHQGSLIGSTNMMLANEKRTLGAIFLSTGDLSTNSSSSAATGNAMINIMTQLFDCFERNETSTIDTTTTTTSDAFRLSSIIYPLFPIYLVRNVMFD